MGLFGLFLSKEEKLRAKFRARFKKAVKENRKGSLSNDIFLSNTYLLIRSELKFSRMNEALEEREKSLNNFSEIVLKNQKGEPINPEIISEYNKRIEEKLDEKYERIDKILDEEYEKAKQKYKN